MVKTARTDGDNALETGRFSYDGLDRVLHEKARLGIMTSLMTHPEGLVFGELRDLCALTDGNLSRHIEVLSEASLVKVWKGYEGKRPQTLLRITPLGRKRFLEYLAELERVIQDVQAKEMIQSKSPDENLPPGWVPA
jgi:DNA-binding MarR family transcriptional regulator